MSDILEAARQLRDKLASDAALAKDRAEYLRTVANWSDMVRIVDGLAAILDDSTATEAQRLDAADSVLGLNQLLNE